MIDRKLLPHVDKVFFWSFIEETGSLTVQEAVYEVRESDQEGVLSYCLDGLLNVSCLYSHYEANCYLSEIECLVKAIHSGESELDYMSNWLPSDERNLDAEKELSWNLKELNFRLKEILNYVDEDSI